MPSVSGMLYRCRHASTDGDREEGSRDNVRNNVESRETRDRRNRIPGSFHVVKSAAAVSGAARVERNETRKFYAVHEGIQLDIQPR